MSTRLQATLQTTAMLSNLSLLNYICSKPKNARAQPGHCAF
jgi:hypothetical protein